MAASDVRKVDGTYDFSLGVDSSRVPTVRSEVVPNGLLRNQLSWLGNGTVRGGGIFPRPGQKFLTKLHNGGVLYQGGWLYEQSLGNPYLILQIDGRLLQVRVDTDNSINDLSTPSGLTQPNLVRQAFMCQGEQFLVMQAGDYLTSPLFWDGTTLRRSNGINSFPIPRELPAAGPMSYYRGRLWYAQKSTTSQKRTVIAGDIVGNTSSGTLPYQFTDSILKVTENPLAVGGDGFFIPSQAGDITALAYTANMNSVLGEGPLYIFTSRQVYQLSVPVSRNDWIAATANNQPVQVPAQRKFGATSERAVVSVNSDLFYLTPEPAIRSLAVSIRNDRSWVNTPLSNNEQRALQFTAANSLGTATGIFFDNRLLMGIMPVSTPAGIAFQGLAPLDMDLISTLQDQLPPAWEGMQEGLDILQLFEGDFGGTQRAFAVVHARLSGNIELWEITLNEKVDTNGADENRIQWYFETPAFTWGKEFDLKKLDGGELYLDRISGTVNVEVDYREDSNPCWHPWAIGQVCFAQTTCENVLNPICYPSTAQCEGQKLPLVLPTTKGEQCSPGNGRPNNVGYQFQIRVSIKGSCRVRGLLLYAIPVARMPYDGLTCA